MDGTIETGLLRVLSLNAIYPRLMRAVSVVEVPKDCPYLGFVRATKTGYEISVKSGLPANQTEFILLHELHHVLYDAFGLGAKGLNPKAVNVAQDAIINTHLETEYCQYEGVTESLNGFSLKTLSSLLKVDLDINQHDTIDIYNLLKDNADKAESAGGSFDKHELERSSEEDAAAAKEAVKGAVEDLIAKDPQVAPGIFGHVAAKKYEKNKTEAQFLELRRALSSAVRSRIAHNKKRSWKRDNRKELSPFIPGKRKDKVTSAAIAIDVSGSIGLQHEKLTTIFNTIVASGISSVDLYLFNETVHTVKKCVRPVDLCISYTGGGEDINAVNSIKGNYDFKLVISDFECAPFKFEDPDWVMLSLGNKGTHPNAGKVMRVV